MPWLPLIGYFCIKISTLGGVVRILIVKTPQKNVTLMELFETTIVVLNG